MNTKRSRIVMAAVVTVTFLGSRSAAGQVHRRQTAIPRPPKAAAPELLVAEGVIYGDPTATESSLWPRAFLPVTLWGRKGAVMLDLGAVSDGVQLSSTFGLPSSSGLAGVFLPQEMSDTALKIGTIQEKRVFLKNSSLTDTVVTPAAMGPYAGIMGMQVLSRYDVEFDGSTGRVRLYKPVANQSDAAAQLWLPPGLTQADCVPLQHYPAYDSGSEWFPAIPLKANGSPVLSIFDSGSPFTIMNKIEADSLKLTHTSPNVHSVNTIMSYATPGTTVRESQHDAVTGITLSLGSHRLASGEILIFPVIPMGPPPFKEIVNLGLDAIRDRIMFFSFSSSYVCLSDAIGATPAKTPHAVPAAEH